MEYLPLLRNNLTWGNEECKGVPIADIDALETEIGKTFPKAYREFLELAGDYFIYLYAGDASFELLGKIQNWLKKELSIYKQDLEKECWAFQTYDSEQFMIFYWDEGDDPPVYLCIPYEAHLGGNLIYKEYASFTDYINEDIRLARKEVIS
ncbi:MAG: SMI1/KNR4 family protein [Chitinophagales bacterium]|nr:SMI1/KNR4 family protein [Chitinophagales bacterium]